MPTQTPNAAPAAPAPTPTVAPAASAPKKARVTREADPTKWSRWVSNAEFETAAEYISVRDWAREHGASMARMGRETLLAFVGNRAIDQAAFAAKRTPGASTAKVAKLNTALAGAYERNLLLGVIGTTAAKGGDVAEAVAAVQAFDAAHPEVLAAMKAAAGA